VSRCSSLVGWSRRLCRFWAAMARGEFVTVAAAEAGTYREMGTRWLAASGGVRPAPRARSQGSLFDVF
jgi:hypothetical protein